MVPALCPSAVVAASCGGAPKSIGSEVRLIRSCQEEVKEWLFHSRSLDRSARAPALRVIAERYLHFAHDRYPAASSRKRNYPR